MASSGVMGGLLWFLFGRWIYGHPSLWSKSTPPKSGILCSKGESKGWSMFGASIFLWSMLGAFLELWSTHSKLGALWSKYFLPFSVIIHRPISLTAKRSL
jgi:hypothetical protein